MSRETWFNRIFSLKKISGKIFWNFNHRTAKVDMAMNCVDLSAGGPKKKGFGCGHFGTCCLMEDAKKPR